MHAAPTHSTARARLILPALLGFVAGTALQLQQPTLLAWPVYASFVLLAPVLYRLAAIKLVANIHRSALMALALAVLAFGVTGLRASIHAGQALDASLEGRDVAVSGVIAKKRTASVFGPINREALARTSSDRRNRLYSDAQVLTKPEIVRQRVLGGLTDPASLDAMDWRSAPPELMPFGKLPKDPDAIKCEMLKYGDYLIFVALRKGKWAYWVKNTQTVTADSYKVNWRTAPKGFTRLDALIRICSDFPTFTWWPMSARDLMR